MTVLLILFLGIIALLYSSVGHGGASGYIAVFSLMNYLPNTYKPLVLVLNVVTASIAFYHFYKAGYFKPQFALSFVLASVPMAFIGAQIHLPIVVFNKILGIVLVLASIQLLVLTRLKANSANKAALRTPKVYEFIIGGGLIGLISGLLSIGGGIFLSPLILLRRWADVKTTAATSSFFIVCNSLAGLATVKFNQVQFSITDIGFCIAFVLICGILGGTLGSKILKPRVVQQVLSVTLFFAGLKLFFLIK